MEEIWKDIPGYEGIYQVSNLGRLRSAHNNRYGVSGKYKILKGSTGKNCYISVLLIDPSTGRKSRHLLHRIVASVFIPNPDGKGVIDHINTIRNDNRVENLRWATTKENCNNAITIKRMTDKRRDYGISHRGNQSSSAKAVVQLDFDNNVVATFGSIVEASKATGFSRKRISHNLRGEQKNSRHFYI